MKKSKNITGNYSKKFLEKIRSEKGISTVEIAIIVAVLVGIALIFRGAIMSFVNDIIQNMFPPTTPFDNSVVN